MTNGLVNHPVLKNLKPHQTWHFSPLPQNPRSASAYSKFVREVLVEKTKLLVRIKIAFLKML